jgi:ABC-type molybdate transport system substrate-binding protein
MTPIALPSLRILAAGSLRHALHAYNSHGADAELVLGPAGLLRRRIEAGEAGDLFLSANLAHPRALAAGSGASVVGFARNRIVAIARPELGLREETFLDCLLDPRVRIGTSTPGADPGGDYAQMLFRRADALRPGAAAVLAAKARRLVGGSVPPAVPQGADPARHFLASGDVDLFISYRTTALRLTPEFDLVAPPAALAVVAEYGAVVLASAGPRRATAEQYMAGLRDGSGHDCLLAAGFESYSG